MVGAELHGVRAAAVLAREAAQVVELAVNLPERRSLRLVRIARVVCVTDEETAMRVVPVGFVL